MEDNGACGCEPAVSLDCPRGIRHFLRPARSTRDDSASPGCDDLYLTVSQIGFAPMLTAIAQLGTLYLTGW